MGCQNPHGGAASCAAMADSHGQRKVGGTLPAFRFWPRLYRRGQNARRSTASLLAVLPPTSALAVNQRSVHRRMPPSPHMPQQMMPAEENSEHRVKQLRGEDLHCKCCCDLGLEETMARVSGERAPAFTSKELEKLVDGVLPQYTLLYGPPDKQVSAHQKKDIYRAIAKHVRTLGVYHRRSTHCRKRWEDTRCWSKKMAEAQLGMASQRGRGAQRIMTPLMFRILVVAYPELDGRLRASQQPQGVLADSLLAVLLHRARPLGQVRRWRHPPVYRPLVDLSTMEERHVIVTYRLDRATIHELCAQLEPDLMSAIRHPTGIPPLVQVLSVLHFLASGSFQTTVAIASGMSQPMFSNVVSRVLSALLKHMRSYIVFPQVEDLPTLKGDFYALGHIPNIIGAIDGTHVALVPPAGGKSMPRRGFRASHATGFKLAWLMRGETPKPIIVAFCMLHNLALRRQVPFLQEDGPDGGVVAAVEPVDSEDEEAEEEDIDNRNTVIHRFFQ
ncbi:hypothetical protein NDU88_002701 [Pleurodeles waltl]|uniref:Myb/SANT-like DNA-binding domain-containing protein n=1 Tax=Pleurodeles waltl TaxID=8319 RepID=A0AAV7Q9M0_PLEWA|nr:hypothetical protein NDU88_002701 [Pleurodeles waltl]